MSIIPAVAVDVTFQWMFTKCLLDQVLSDGRLGMGEDVTITKTMGRLKMGHGK